MRARPITRLGPGHSAGIRHTDFDGNHDGIQPHRTSDAAGVRSRSRAVGTLLREGCSWFGPSGLPDLRSGLKLCRERAVTGTDPLREEAARVRQQWRPGRPGKWTAADAEDLIPLLPTVREFVAKADPRDGERAMRCMRAVAGHILEAHRRLGTTAAAVVWHPDSVEHYIHVTCAHRTENWRRSTRATLRAVGRAVAPELWPTPTTQLIGPQASKAYDALDEESFRLTAQLPHETYVAAWKFVPTGALGMGISGPVMARAHPRDVIEIAEGRLAMWVTGAHPRLVPVRREYTDLMRAAMDAADDGPFIESQYRHTANSIAAAIHGRPGQLSLHRARMTWVKAHLLAGTSLPALRRMAGTLSGHTIHAALADAASEVDDHTAAIEGLKA